MKRSLFLLFALLIGATHVFAERISPEKALSIANSGARTASGMKTRAGGMQAEFSQVVASTEGYFVVSTPTGQGFAIIAADDAVPSPIGAYSPDALSRQIQLPCLRS